MNHAVEREELNLPQADQIEKQLQGGTRAEPAYEAENNSEVPSGRNPQNLTYQQQQAQRIARQLLSQPASQNTARYQQPQFTSVQQQIRDNPIMMAHQQYLTSSQQADPNRAFPAMPYGAGNYGNLSVNMPPLQGALQQEVPASLSGEVMRPEAATHAMRNTALDDFMGTLGQNNVKVMIEKDSTNFQEDDELTTRNKRSSKYRGVTRHRRSGRWEAHIWVKQSGKQVYLGGYELEEHAAEAYDVAAIKCKGPRVKTNFPLEKYRELMRFMDAISLEELVMAVRRQSQGFARGSSGYRGVTHHPNGRWEARIGMPGSKHIYLGLFNEEQMAAQAYDRALVKLRGPSAATNFALSEYKPELQDYYRRLELEKDGDVDVAAMLKADIRKTNKEISTQTQRYDPKAMDKIKQVANFQMAHI